MESLVVTVIGKDRPGLVESVSAAVEANGGSWVESRMSRLAGEFAGILRVSVPAAQADALSGALEALRADGLRVVVERGVEDAVEEGHLIVLELIGSDRPGIVHKISEALAVRGVNVDELNTECEGAPWSGDTLFKAMARLRAPKGLDLDHLRESLEAIAADLMVDISIGEAD
ncbi:MAG: glycine cleavage system protein R [Deltaproteobacteria bacterium]|nr:glycine cleavage system protein R [Deltaproteobacteria bacterium]NND29765.1 glycine cleavage system protein R [Myxococcales bacterium]MBT8465561.1 glycine cleavage system protein R [Deltaproteobacteria bacterium]MBT8480151.1 glycine cleavage system protein R [Deltaproteobacteria bacterium]NNK09603.1 glycine cleavage system protein R [Myxococcales bacterium]